MGGNVICRCRGAGFDQRRASIAIDLSFSMAIRRQRQRQHQQQQQQQQQQRQQQDRSNKTTIKPRKESAPLSMISLINLCLEVTFYRLIQVLCNESDSKFQCRGLIRPPPPRPGREPALRRNRSMFLSSYRGANGVISSYIWGLNPFKGETVSPIHLFLQRGLPLRPPFEFSLLADEWTRPAGTGPVKPGNEKNPVKSHFFRVPLSPLAFSSSC